MVPRFYFHFFNDVETRDEEGRDLPDSEAARRAATDDARYMAAEGVRGGFLNLAHYVEVATEAGEPLFSVSFGDAVEVVDRAAAAKQGGRESS